MPKASEAAPAAQPTVPTLPPQQLPPLPGMPPAQQPTENPTIAALQAQLAAAQAAQQQQFVAEAAGQPPVAPPTVPVAPIAPSLSPPAPVVMQVPSPVPAAAPPVIPSSPNVNGVASVSVMAGGLDVAQQMAALQNQQIMGGGADLLRSFDLSAVETQNFRLLPLEISAYEAKISKVEMKKSSTGFPQLKVTLSTVFPTAWAGVTLIDHITIKPETMWKYKGFLNACGLLTPDGSRFAGESLNDFVGKVVQFQIKHDPYDGQLRNKVNGSYSAGTLYEEQPAASIGLSGMPTVQWPAQPAGVSG